MTHNNEPAREHEPTLFASSADNLCKPFVPRPGPTERLILDQNRLAL